MKKEKLNQFLKDLSYRTKYTVLELGKDDDELGQIAKKHHLTFPNKDLAIFKGIYCFIDEENQNGCLLPKEEVEKALNTIAGKAVDFDHLRKRVVGYWLEGFIEDNKVISYGVFFKGNFEDDYDKVKDLMSQGKLGISMEAWIAREFNDDGSYTASDIEFSGGALLIEEKPAFKDAEVLEFAKTLTAPRTFIRSKKEEAEEKKFFENSRFYLYDLEAMIRMMWEVKCPDCGKENSMSGVDAIDFTQGLIKTKCMSCDSTVLISVTPRAASIKSEEARKVEKVEVDKSPSNGDRSDKNKSSVEDNKKMEEVKKLQEEVAKLQEKSGAKDQEIATLREKLESAKSELTDLKTKMEEASVELEKARSEKDEAIAKAREQATIIAERKAELGEFAKEMSDEDILNEDKYENTQLKKKLAEAEVKAKGKNKEKSSTKDKLEVGSDDEETETQKTAKRISELAFRE